MTKSEVYSSIIKMNKKSGQGLSGIVRTKSEFAEYLDELVAEGLIVACHTGGSIGHPDSNIFYMPVSGYNVWLDDEGNTSHHKGKNLFFVRLYLCILNIEPTNKFDMSMKEMLQSSSTMSEYSKWLSKNDEQLSIMINMDEEYPGTEENVFSDEQLEWLKSRDWYKQNKKVKDCLKDSIDVLEKDEKVISLLNQMMPLYRQNTKKYQEKISDTETEIEETKSKISFRKKLNRFLTDQNQNSNIQDII
jgi:hypothetical protein